MKMIKLRFTNPTNDAAGALALAKKFKVICLPNDTYEVPDQALELLDEFQLPYVLLETEGFDHAIRALRNSLTTPV